MSNVTKPILLDETGKSIITAIEQVANKISSNSTEPIHTMKYPSDNEIVGSGVYATAYSYEDFSFDQLSSNQLHTLTLIERKTSTGNLYGRNTHLGIYKDANNYLKLYGSAYNGGIVNRANNTDLNNISITGLVNLINPYPLVMYVWNFDSKELKVLGRTKAGVTTLLVSQDISSWNLSALDKFKIYFDIGANSTVSPYLFLAINGLVFEWEKYIDGKLYYAKYNCGEIRHYGEQAQYPIGIGSNGWTVTSTISSTHKIGTFNLASDTYFGCAGYVNGVTSNPMTFFKFKITNGSSVKIRKGAVVSATIYNVNYETLWVNDTTRSGYFEPENDTWYYCLIRGGQQTLNYISTYNWWLQGSGTIEVIGLCCGYDRTQNICADTYNGSYFTGAIPLSAPGAPLGNVIYQSSLGAQLIFPIGATEYADNGTIKVFNGTAWKQINNS